MVGSLKIALFIPGRTGGIRGGKSWLPSGSLLEVAGMTPPEHEVLIYDEMVQGLLTEKTLPKADLYGIGGYTPSRYGAYRLTEMIRGRGGMVVAGGMDVTGLQAEGREAELVGRFDSIVVGRLTSRLWRTILSNASAGHLKPVYWADPDEPWEFALPRHDLVDRRRYFIPAAIRSSAGCTESCLFCSVHLIGGRGTHLKSRDLLEQEISMLPASRFFVDASDSFGCDYGHTEEIILPLYGKYCRKHRRRWFTEITIGNLMGCDGHAPLLELMAKNGCAGVYVGVESIVRSVSGKSLRLPVVEGAIKKAHEAGMMVLASLILDVTGEETWESIKRTVQWVMDQRLEFVQYSLTALLPGSTLRQRALKNGLIIDDNTEHMDGAWPTMRHSMSPEDRINALQWAYKTTYSSINVGLRLRDTHKLTEAIAWLANHKISMTARRWARHATYEYWVKTYENPNRDYSGS